MRRHAAAKGFTTGQQRYAGVLRMRIVYDAGYRFSGQRRFVRQLAALLHIQKVIPHGTDTVVCQGVCKRLHKAVQHACPGAVAEYQ